MAGMDIASQVEEKKRQEQKETALKQKELEQKQEEKRIERLEDLRHKENTKLARIGIALAVIALLVSLIALLK